MSHFGYLFSDLGHMYYFSQHGSKLAHNMSILLFYELALERQKLQQIEIQLSEMRMHWEI